MGYTPQLAAAVWVGYSEGMIPVQRTTINGKFVRNAYGSTIAAPTWQRFMRQAHEGLPEAAFPAPGVLEVEGQRVTVPRVIGRTEAQARATLRDAGFIVRVASERREANVTPGRVASTSPGSGSRVTRGGVITIYLSSGPAPAPAPEPEPEPGDAAPDEATPDEGD
ncbi:PASTA domain-containing protein [Cellulomonas sp. ATA003]|uniref:PASTA domain-containing protein n=1 Tax=Cellulomonas sp. ATA003 TaxID=3073064 RepID=UPI0028737133|nr:PASTA domain-containing protein [Cellulomonas sp. ATA003]WNB85882.1 PASTA domain-containing protein [Cellulomonas sp. ATA003]